MFKLACLHRLKGNEHILVGGGAYPPEGRPPSRTAGPPGPVAPPNRMMSPPQGHGRKTAHPKPVCAPFSRTDPRRNPSARSIRTCASSRRSIACSTITWPLPVCQSHTSTFRTLRCPPAHEYYPTTTSTAAPAAAQRIWSSARNPTRRSDSTAAATPSSTRRSSRRTSYTSSCSFDKCTCPSTCSGPSPTNVMSVILADL